MTHKTVKEAIGKSDEVLSWRGDGMIPAINYDIAMCLYERELDGSDTDTPFLTFGRPQNFATDEHMKYQVFGAMRTFEKDGDQYVACYLIHLYWDGSRDEDSARELILNHGMYPHGDWEPTAPSDPLKLDDFWDYDDLGSPPNGYWDYDFDDDGKRSFEGFNNFEREPYKKVQLGKRDG